MMMLGWHVLPGRGNGTGKGEGKGIEACSGSPSVNRRSYCFILYHCFSLQARHAFQLVVALVCAVDSSLIKFSTPTSFKGTSLHSKECLASPASQSRIFKLAKSLFRKPPWPPLHFLAIGFEVVSEHVILEEEQLQECKRGPYYPVNIGGVFDAKYQIVGKLGVGVSSTVWLARDMV
jgi:hypothetical protein